jgi:hypothetical protein
MARRAHLVVGVGMEVGGVLNDAVAVHRPVERGCVEAVLGNVQILYHHL